MKIIEVSAAIIRDKDKILITKRLGGEFDAMWEFPGGKLEKNETKEDALLREIHEELNLKIKIDSYLTTIEYTYESFHLVMHTFFCSIDSGTLTLNDHSDFKWVDLSNLDDIVWVPADIDVIKAIKISQDSVRK